MKPADTTADVRALVQQSEVQALAHFVPLPSTALRAFYWPQVKPMPKPVIRGKQQ